MTGRDFDNYDMYQPQFDSKNVHRAYSDKFYDEVSNSRFYYINFHIIQDTEELKQTHLNQPYDYKIPVQPAENSSEDRESKKETGSGENEKQREMVNQEDAIIPNKILDFTRPIIEYDPDAKIKVMEPSTVSGMFSRYTEYTLKGEDEQGEFSVTRRYKEFYTLRSIIVKNWPGFYIPAIPPKVKLGKTGAQVVQERCYLFNKFMKKISEINYLWDSLEVKMFIRPQMGVSESLSLLPAPTSDEKLERMKLVMKVNEDLDDLTVNRYSESIRDFVICSKDIFPLLNRFNNCITQLEKQRQYQLSAYSEFSDFLSQYEMTTLSIYS